MESYVERWAREQREAKEKQNAEKHSKNRKPQKVKGVDKHGTDTGSEGQAAQKE